MARQNLHRNYQRALGILRERHRAEFDTIYTELAGEPEPVGSIRKTDNVCGTQAGYMRHRRRGELICDECRAAQSRASREYRRKQRRKR